MSDLISDLGFNTEACRICFQNNEYDMIPLFEPPPEGSKPTIIEQIEKCAGVEIIPHNKLSSSICSNCIAFLNIAYKFRSMCFNSQTYLMEYVIQTYDDADDEEIEPEQLDNENDEIVHSTSQLDEDEQFQNNEDKKNNSFTTSFTHSDELSEDYYAEENLFEDDYMTNGLSTTIDTNDRNGKIERDKRDTNATSKTLGISSDGAAVIEEKTKEPVLRRPQKEKRKHICDICGNIYDRRYTLASHMRRHRDEKPYDCEICGQAFHCNFELTRHIRKHTGHKPYECDYCKRAFGDRSTLLKHIRVHRNERPYKCNTCGKSFTYSSVLKVHQLTHTGEKPYNCDLCGKRFSRSHHLRAHLETLLHQDDPQAKVLLKKIKRVEDNFDLVSEIFATA